MVSNRAPDFPVLLDIPPTTFLLSITDEMRELCEVKLGCPELVANKGAVSMDAFINQCAKHNLSNPESPVSVGKILGKSKVITRKQPMAEVYLEKLSPVEQMRLSAAERAYQRKIHRVLPTFKRAWEISRVWQQGGTYHESGLAFELKGPAWMALNLLLGIFICFLIGFYGVKYMFEIDNISTRAIAGLFTSLLCLLVETALIITRHVKLEKIEQEQKRKHQARLERARAQATENELSNSERTKETHLNGRERSPGQHVTEGEPIETDTSTSVNDQARETQLREEMMPAGVSNSSIDTTQGNIRQRVPNLC